MKTPLCRTPICLVISLACSLLYSPINAQEHTAKREPVIVEDPVDALIEEILSKRSAYERLVELCDGFGHRLTGSQALEDAIDWTISRLIQAGHENVGREPVEVRKWIRGDESISLIYPRTEPLVMLGLGNSVGSAGEAIEADVVVVPDHEILEALGEKVRGKIVLFNNPMPEWTEDKGTCYGQTVVYRVRGADMASALGARAVMVRSVTAHSLRTPHTGTLVYDGETTKIPAAAISTEDADMLQRYQDRGKRIRVRFQMDATFAEPVISGNVIAEIVGHELPEEVVVIGGHIDSWDVGQGAHDDGAGVVMAMETLNAIRRLGLRPRRTIRLVLWTNEENGMGGSKAYLKRHLKEMPQHAAALEADFGGFAPSAFGVALEDKEKEAKAAAFLEKAMKRLVATGNIDIKAGSSAPDVARLVEHGVPCLGLYTHSKNYFDYHHTKADTVDKVDPTELTRSAAAFAALAWILANMEGRLGE